MVSGQVIARGEHRRAERHRSSINVAVMYQGRRVEGRLFDISRTGLCIQMKEAFFASAGAVITVKSEELGALECIIRWRKDSRVGAVFGMSSNTIAKVDHYFRDYLSGPKTRPRLFA